MRIYDRHICLFVRCLLFFGEAKKQARRTKALRKNTIHKCILTSDERESPGYDIPTPSLASIHKYLQIYDLRKEFRFFGRTSSCLVNLATPQEKPGINTLALSAVQIEFPSLSAPYPHDGVCLPGYIEPVVVLMNCPS